MFNMVGAGFMFNTVGAGVMCNTVGVQNGGPAGVTCQHTIFPWPVHCGVCGAKGIFSTG
jgi:hypothetical protein